MKQIIALLVFILFPLFASAQTAAELFNQGIASYNAKDYANAVKYYEQAAFQGHDSAQCNMGFIYVNGILGVKKDYKKAFNWYQEAATNGNAIAQYNLGAMYYSGRGCRVDEKMAFLWFEKSALQGYANAQQNLGFMYENGTGVNKDLAKAIEWYEKAAAQGNEMSASSAAAIRVRPDGEQRYTDWESEDILEGTFSGTWKLRYYSPEGMTGEKRNCLLLNAPYDDTNSHLMAYSNIATFDYADETTLRFEGFYFKDDDGMITFQRGDAAPSF